MPSSSSSAGFSSRGVISSWLYASAMSTPRRNSGAARSISSGGETNRRRGMPYELPSLPYADDALADTFGDVGQLKAALNDGGVKRFGSGWTWLVWDGTGLAVYSTPNQDSPWLQDDVPLLGIDVWEHAYYLHYQNRRPDYLNA